MNKKILRVVHIIGKVEMGGVQAVVMNYYRNIDKTKVQFDFIIDGYNETPIDKEIEGMGGKAYKIEPYEKNVFKNMLQCYKIFKTNKYTIVHCHLNTLSVFPLFVAWICKIKIRICHNHSTAAKGEGKKNLIKYILLPFSKLFATHYCACSELSGKWIFGNKFYNKGKVKLIKNAIDINKYSYNKSVRDKKREQMNLNNKFVIGHVGRFAFSKNHNFLIDIFNEAYKINNNLILILVGDGQLKNQIQYKVKKLGLKDNILFLGNRFDVPELMQAMDLFLLPSFYEGLPVVGVEAQAAGLKCIFSDSITYETKITDLVEFISLNKSSKYWANQIIKYSNGYNRENTDIQIKKAGYEIKIAAHNLLLWYKKLLYNFPK